MPSLESKLLYERAQQTNPWRAGTPGRALRNRQAVVRYWRPLCFFMALSAFQMAHPDTGWSQNTSGKPTISLRLGAFYATPLVKDAVSSAGLDESIPGRRSHDVRLRQKPGPIATVAARFPMRAKTSIELSGSVGTSMIQGSDGLASWDFTTGTVGNVVLGFGYLYRRLIELHAGIGITKLFAEQRGLFAKGNSIKPVIDVGASGTPVSIGGRPIDIDVRLQSHSFGTATLRDNGGGDGNVTRAIVQIGTALWRGGR